MKVSILLLSFNEAQNLPTVLKSLSWCEDIVVLDSGSNDNSVDIAKSFGARVLTRSFDNFASQRNWGLDNGDFRNEWVLHLDADEVITPEFVNVLNSFEPLGRFDAYNVPSKLMLFDKWIKHSGMYPTYQVRLGHRERLRFAQVGHGQREDLPPSRVGFFKEPYLHYSFSHGMHHWLSKHINYARDEACLILENKSNLSYSEFGNSVSRRRNAKAVAAKIPTSIRPFARFFYVYFFRQGFRDGKAGFVYAFMMALYEGMTALFLYEQKMGSSSIPKPSQKGTTSL
jgi:glycosyltransferase involved in cell wall biosynthesis